MEKLICLVLPLLMATVLIRLLLMPLGLVCKLCLHSACGFLCLWLLNAIAPFTGILLPVNLVTVLTAAFLGLPGIGIVAALTVL